MILKRSLLKFLKTGAIPLLLTAVALRQIVLVHTAGLSPWHGGGFGMFASIDRDERRVVTTEVIGCNPTSEKILLSDIVDEFPDVLGRHTYIHVSTFPTPSQLRRIGRRLLSEDSQNSGLELYDTSEGSCDPKIQLQAWRLVYDGDAIAYEPLTKPVEVKP